ncbi:MAG: radical SAM protein [Thermodesulfobacteriota bacterium]
MTGRTVCFSKNAVNVFFHILTRCNLHCTHCYINPDQHGKQTLSINVIRRWLDAFIEKAAVANVIFLGGEPTLHPELSEAVRYARQIGYHSITIDTNGYLFNDILSRVSPDEVDYVSFSLDGATRTTNDAIRGRGSYDQCLSGIRRSVAGGFKTSLIYTVSAANIHELEKMRPLLADLKTDRFFIQVIGIRGKSAIKGFDGKAPLQVSPGQWQAVVPAAAEAIAREGITVTYPRVYLSTGETFECAGLVADNYFIFPNGRVYRCPLCEDYPFHSLVFENDRLKKTPPLNETDFFRLSIPEGCVMNKLIQPDNLSYDDKGRPEYRVACCLLKEELSVKD